MRFKDISREVATVLSGSVVAQAITLAAYFVLLRIFSPADYGLFTVFYSYIEVLVIVSTCKYEMGVVAADSDRSAAALGRFALRLNAILSSLLLAVLAVLTLAGWLPGKFSQLGWVSMLIAPMVFFLGNNRILSSLYNRFHHYRAIATSDIVGALSAAVIKATLGLLGMNRAGMPLGAVLGQAAANVNYRVGIRRLPLPAVGSDEYRAEARHHSNYPRYVAPKDFINSFSANLPFLWLALYFDNASVGLLAIAVTFIIRPCHIIGAAFERVLFARTAEDVRNGRPVLQPLLRFVALAEGVAVAVAVVLWLYAEPLMAFCFGDRWSGCGIYIDALLPWAVALAASLPLMYIPNIYGTQRTELFIHLGQLALRIAAIAIGIATGSFLLGVQLFAAVSALTSFSLTAWYLTQTSRSHTRRDKAAH